MLVWVGGAEVGPDDCAKEMKAWAGVAVGSAALVVAMSWTASAQDTRQVTEPKIPPSCVKLPAKLRAVEDKIADADEGKLDTERIQEALDTCKPGMAVEFETSERQQCLPERAAGDAHGRDLAGG